MESSSPDPRRGGGHASAWLLAITGLVLFGRDLVGGSVARGAGSGDVERGHHDRADAEQPGREREQDRPREVPSRGWRPPRIHGRTRSARVIAVVTISLTTSAVDPVARRTPRTWRAESTFAAIRTRLSTTKRMRVQSGSITTSVSDIPSGIDRTIRVMRVPSANTSRTHRVEHIPRAIPSPESGLDVEEHPDEEEADQRGRDLRHVEQEGVRHPSHGPSAYPRSVVVRPGRLAAYASEGIERTSSAQGRST
ncbi:MAG: hypothetical protein K0R20_1111 [Actinomycetia bacterium]|nr:hypothetical protein [Actinomycetes bacterium]